MRALGIAGMVALVAVMAGIGGYYTYYRSGNLVLGVALACVFAAVFLGLLWRALAAQR